MKHTIVIVDDHILIAKALSDMISKFLKFEVSYVCENGLDLQKKIKTKPLPKLRLGNRKA